VINRRERAQLQANGHVAEGEVEIDDANPGVRRLVGQRALRESEAADS
jgi:hypothetical protein